jgi:hypothetical protein
MSVNVSQFITKIQEDGLNTLKQTQDASLAAMGEFRKFATEMSDKPGTMPTFENIPTPTQLVELSFGFAGQFLELRKAYTLKVAELITETSKQAEAAVKQTVSQVNSQIHQATNGQVNNGQVNAPAAPVKAATK